MTYFYQGQERFRCFFDSPNECATVLAMGLCFVAAILSGKARQAFFTLKEKWGILLLTAGLFIGVLALAQTYSRGGWVAFSAGLSALFLLFAFGKNSHANPRRTLFVILGVFIVFFGTLLAQPQGCSRIASASQIREDLSVWHRLLVWKGALAMMADHWKSGVGEKKFGSVYGERYQPRTMNTNYFSAVNNWLTAGAEGGIFRLAGYWALLFASWWAAVLWSKSSPNAFFLGTLAAMVAHEVSGLFTASFTQPAVVWFWRACWAWVLLFDLWMIQKNSRLLLSLKLWVPSLSMLLLLTGLFSGMGIYFASQEPTQTTPLLIPSKNQSFVGLLVEPRKSGTTRMVVYFHDKDRKVSQECKKILRYWGEQDWKVLAANAADDGFQGLADAKEILEWAHENRETLGAKQIVVVGMGSGGRKALLAAAAMPWGALSGVVAFRAEAEWPFPELSPVEHIDTISCPIIFVTRKEDPAFDSRYHSEILKRRAWKTGNDFQLFEIEKASSFLDDRMLDLVEKLP